MLTSLFRAIILIAILVLSLWFAFYVMTVGLLVGVVFGGFLFLRRFLVDKGIIVPSAPLRYQARYAKARRKSAQSAEIINVEYHEVTMGESSEDVDPRSAGGKR